MATQIQEFFPCPASPVGLRFGDAALLYRFRSLKDLLEFYAHSYCRLVALLAEVPPSLIPNKLHDAEVSPDFMASVAAWLMELRDECAKIRLQCSIDGINDILDRINECIPAWIIGDMLPDVLRRIQSELKGRIFLAVPYDLMEAYSSPLAGWDAVLVRFAVEDDVSEARRCLALDRPTASVFHMMRVLEVGVLALEQFLGSPDPKAHFGTVLGRLDKYLQKTPYEQLPEHVKAKLSFLKQLLPLLQGINDAWRNKAAHAEGRTVPTAVFTVELAGVIYGRSFELMKILAAEL